VSAETALSSNIPVTGVTVKKMLVAALAGVPVRVRDFGMDVSKDATVSEALSALGGIRDVENAFCVRSRFCAGDLFRQMSLRGADKRAFIAGVKAAHGESYYNALRRYGWVAGKWSEERRSDSRCWAWYVNHEPGRPGAVKVEKPIAELSLVSREGDMLTLETPGGVRWLYRLETD
jgi:hypothetical protein